MARRAPEQPTPKSCDVVIIGAGVGGLTAAALLTRAGLEIVVVEAEHRLGGYLAGFERKKFKFDSAIHWLNQCGPGGFVRRMFEHIAPGAPECLPIKRIRRFKGESFDYLLTNNPDELRDRFSEDFPSDAAGIARLFAEGKRIGQCFEGLSRLMRARETRALLEWPGFGLKVARSGIPFIKHLEAGARKGLARYVDGSGLAKVFCTEKDFMSILVPLAWAYGGDFQAPPPGGGQALPQWLNDQACAGGARVLLRRRVERIILDGNRAVGVELDRGESIRAGHVLAASDVETLYEKMLPSGAVPASLLERLKEAELYDSSVIISLGLDCTAADLGLDESMVILTRDGIAREEHSTGDPHKSALIVLSSSSRDSTMAPEGKGTLTIFSSVTMAYGDRWGLEPDGTKGDRYREVKNDYAEALLDRVEETLVPELRKHIEIKDVATPVTLLRYTGNRDGSIMGARPGRANIKKKLAHYRTPVERLLLSGHWAEYGGGVPVAVKAGTNASLLVLKDLNHPEYRNLCAVMDGP